MSTRYQLVMANEIIYPGVQLKISSTIMTEPWALNDSIDITRVRLCQDLCEKKRFPHLIGRACHSMPMLGSSYPSVKYQRDWLTIDLKSIFCIPKYTQELCALDLTVIVHTIQSIWSTNESIYFRSLSQIGPFIMRLCTSAHFHVSNVSWNYSTDWRWHWVRSRAYYNWTTLKYTLWNVDAWQTEWKYRHDFMLIPIMHFGCVGWTPLWQRTQNQRHCAVIGWDFLTVLPQWFEIRRGSQWPQN